MQTQVDLTDLARVAYREIKKAYAEGFKPKKDDAGKEKK